MRLTSVVLMNDYTPEPIVLSFEDPASQNPYQCLEISGLDADDINWGNNGTGYEAKLRNREVGVRVKLHPEWSDDETYSSLRDQLFRIIQTSRSGELTLGFMDGETIVATISGRVVKMEAVTFTKTPEMEMTISCKDPMLRGEEITSVDVSEFNPALTAVVDDVSTAPHGVVFALKFNAPTATFTILGDGSWTFQTSPSGGFLTNDVVRISSVFGEKGLTILRGASVIPIADSITAGSVWPMIFPGHNGFICSGDVDWEEIEYFTAFWGI